MNLQEMLPPSWREKLAPEFSKPYMAQLQSFLEQEYAAGPVYPPQEDIFTAFRLVDYDDVKVLLFGQDPYHGPGEAHGLSFSVKPGITIPPSLRNIYKEMQSDVGITPPKSGHLEPWARQGVMMLNAVLTVRHKSPNSHQKQGWEKFTDAVLKKLNERQDPLVVILWGGKAIAKTKLIDQDRHFVLTGAHPSPLSAHNGFFGSKPFSRINEKLQEWGKTPINWQI